MSISLRKPCRSLPSLLALTLSTAAAVALAQDSGEEARAARGLRAADFARLSDSARQQISALLAEKESRSPAQRKMASSLIYMARARRGAPLLPNAPGLTALAPARADGRIAIDILAGITKPLVEAIEGAGGEVLYGHSTGNVVRAVLPLEAIETVAGLPEVRHISPAMLGVTQRAAAASHERVRPKLRSVLDRLQPKPMAEPEDATVHANAGAATSEGSKAHGADRARKFFNVDGSGVKIGVLSDSDDFKEQSISTGDLPPDTFTLPGQDGRPGSGEGTAMMEIVHDVAPGAKLYFATAFTSPESFADNIRALRFTYHCDVIVDDVIYFFESPYQDDIIAKAVEDVIADGAMYFSSAGNGGNANDGTSGTWEGDFRRAKGPLATLPGGYEVHDFGGGVISNRVELIGGPLILHWSDPGSLDNPQAADDYDLFVLDADLRNVIVASTDVQDGTGLPFEFLGFLIPSNFRVVVARHTGATDRALHVVLFNGELGLGTGGATFGHNSVAGAFGVAAVDVAEAGGGEFTGGLTTPVELFSSDGYRRVFFDSAGNPYRPGKFLFKNNGGQLRKKPDLTGADGVSTTLPSFSGLNPFFGTSAAAPHAAAIAGLLKSAKPTARARKFRTSLVSGALDIEADGFDRDSGAGIVSAFNSLTLLGATPRVFIDLGAVTATPVSGDGDAFIEPGENANLTVELINNGGAKATSVKGTTGAPGAVMTAPMASYPDIDPGTSAVNSTPFSFSVPSTTACGVRLPFTFVASYAEPGSPKVLGFSVQTGQPSATSTAFSYAGPVVPIPDADNVGVDVPVTVSGAGAISKVAFRIDGTSCNATAGSTTVGLDHTWVGDLVLTLTSPAGTSVTIINQIQNGLNSGNNFCQTMLDDSAATSIQTVTPAQAPFTGTFQPANPLAAFNGESADGTWMLNVSDRAFIDTGSVRAFSLLISGFECN